MLAAGQTSVCRESVVSFGKVYHHTVILVLQHVSCFGICPEIISGLIIDIKSQAVDLGHKSVGILHIVVIYESQRYALRTRVKILIHAGREREDRQDCKYFQYTGFHSFIIYFLVLFRLWLW